ncbi:MAG: hypothetical protein P8Y65_10625, partial [Campylobacterales bacterium]
LDEGRIVMIAVVMQFQFKKHLGIFHAFHLLKIDQFFIQCFDIFDRFFRNRPTERAVTADLFLPVVQRLVL